MTDGSVELIRERMIVLAKLSVNISVFLDGFFDDTKELSEFRGAVELRVSLVLEFGSHD